MNPVLPTLELALSLVEEADASPEDELTIVPVVAEDLQEGVLRSIIEAAGGAYLDASVAAPGVVGRPDDHLAAFVSSGLLIPRPSGDVHASVEFRDGRAEVALDVGDGSEAVTPAYVGLRGAITALFSEELRSVRLAVLTYDESVMERALAEGLGLFLCQSLAGQTLGDVRLLVVLIRNHIDYQRHCARRIASVQYHVTATKCRRRGRRQDNLPVITRTVVKDRTTVLFLGAGFSASSGIPVAQELRQVALRKLLTSDSPPERLIEDFRQFLRNKNRLLLREETMSSRAFAAQLTLERVLREEFYLQGGPEKSPTLEEVAARSASALGRPGTAVTELLRTLSVVPRLILVTVNFDTVLESLAGERVRVFVEEDEFREFPSYLNEYIRDGGRVPLLKLHGTIANPLSLVATLEQTVEGLPKVKDDAIRAILPNEGRVPWIYVGYSMRDTDLIPLLATELFGQHTDESWVAPFPEESIREFVQLSRSNCWSQQPSLEARMITEVADDFMREFASRWAELATPPTR